MKQINQSVKLRIMAGLRNLRIETIIVFLHQIGFSLEASRLAVRYC